MMPSSKIKLHVDKIKKAFAAIQRLWKNHRRYLFLPYKIVHLLDVSNSLISVPLFLDRWFMPLTMKPIKRKTKKIAKINIIVERTKVTVIKMVLSI